MASVTISVCNRAHRSRLPAASPLACRGGCSLPPAPARRFTPLRFRPAFQNCQTADEFDDRSARSGRFRPLKTRNIACSRAPRCASTLAHLGEIVMRAPLMLALVIVVAVITAACGDSKSSLLPTAPSGLAAEAPNVDAGATVRSEE